MPCYSLDEWLSRNSPLKKDDEAKLRARVLRTRPVHNQDELYHLSGHDKMKLATVVFVRELVIAKRGEVIIVPNVRMPTDSGLAAINRY